MIGYFIVAGIAAAAGFGLSWYIFCGRLMLPSRRFIGLGIFVVAALLLPWELSDRYSSAGTSVDDQTTGQSIADIRKPITVVDEPLSDDRSPSSVTYIMSSAKPSYHKPDCPFVKLLKPINIRTFKSFEDLPPDAVPCKRCCPETKH